MSRPAVVTPLAQISDSARINHLFSRPVATFSHPNHEAFQSDLLALLQCRLRDVENRFDYKAETAADLSQWGEVITDRLTAWILASAKQFVEASLGQDLQSVYRTAASRQLGTQNGSGSSFPDTLRTSVDIAVKRSWASFYQKGDRHESHLHPNTALSAIYYVTAPSHCELDLSDPRVGTDYFDPGITIANEGYPTRLRRYPGDLVIFPGWVQHAVPEMQGDGLRVSVSWNLLYQLTSV